MRSQGVIEGMRTRWTEVQGSPEVWKSRGQSPVESGCRTSRGPKSEGGAPNTLHARRETKAGSDKCTQRSNEVGKDK